MAVPGSFDKKGAAEWAEGGMRDWSTQLALVLGVGLAVWILQFLTQQVGSVGQHI